MIRHGHDIAWKSLSFNVPYGTSSDGANDWIVEVHYDVSGYGRTTKEVKFHDLFERTVEVGG
ncbi:MAG: hypothetical protein IKU15_02335 [Clostridia bacterium]|nr:hypothetical protein [Clostridia bacterium]